MIEYTPQSIRLWSRLGSCGAFGLAAMELPGIDDRAVIVTSDLRTFSGLDRFRDRYPDRLYNVGIAEQNMIGVAGGLAKEGFTTFATTYATFAALRCADQVKVTMGYMGLPVKLVGLTSGFAVSILGATHMALEDFALMRALPNITVISPADGLATVKAVLAAAKTDGPVYLRLGGPMGNPPVYKGDFEFVVGRAVTLREGTDLAIVATGSMVHHALEAADLLEGQGMSATVVDMHTLAPLDTETVGHCCRTGTVITVEEHGIVGGLGDAVGAYVLEAGLPARFLKIGVPRRYPHAGSYRYMLEQAGLTGPAIARRITDFMQKAQGASS